MRGWLILATIAVVVPLPVAAQRIAPPSSAAAAFTHRPAKHATELSSRRVRLSLPFQPTHWKTGFLIGTVLGTAFWFAAVGAGGGGELTAGDVIVLTSLGALVGGVPGALIGGLFPKRQAPESQ